MKEHKFVTTRSHAGSIVYRMLFSDGDEKEIPLPQLALFSTPRRPWSRTKDELDEQLRLLGFHGQQDEDAGAPMTTPCTTPVRLPVLTRTKVLLRHTMEAIAPSHDGIDLHLGQKPKLGGRYTDITHSSIYHIMSVVCTSIFCFFLSFCL